MLSEGERSYLKKLRGRRRAAIAVGLLLSLAGGLYAIWGVDQLRSSFGTEADAERSASTWDPLARLALVFAPYHERLREAQPETETERVLLEELDAQTTLSAQLLVLLIRFLFASLLLTAGLILLTSGLGDRRLRAILDSMLEQR